MAVNHPVSYSLHFSTSKTTGERLVTAKDCHKKTLASAAHAEALVAMRNALLQVDPQLAVEMGADPRAVLDHVLESQ